MDEDKQNEIEMLQDILDNVCKLIAETRSNYKELKELEEEVNNRFADKKISKFTYDIELERIRRNYQNIDHSLSSLERQRKIATEKLRELE